MTIIFKIYAAHVQKRFVNFGAILKRIKFQLHLFQPVLIVSFLVHSSDKYAESELFTEVTKRFGS
jgi:hypothetical protein